MTNKYLEKIAFITMLPTVFAANQAAKERNKQVRDAGKDDPEAHLNSIPRGVSSYIGGTIGGAAAGYAGEKLLRTGIPAWIGGAYLGAYGTNKLYRKAFDTDVKDLPDRT